MLESTYERSDRGMCLVGRVAASALGAAQCRPARVDGFGADPRKPPRRSRHGFTVPGVVPFTPPPPATTANCRRCRRLRIRCRGRLRSSGRSIRLPRVIRRCCTTCRASAAASAPAQGQRRLLHPGPRRADGRPEWDPHGMALRRSASTSRVTRWRCTSRAQACREIRAAIEERIARSSTR